MHGAAANNVSPEGMKHLEQVLEANRKVLTRLNHVCRIGVFDGSIFGCLGRLSSYFMPAGASGLACS